MAKKKTKIPTPHEIASSPTIIPSQDIDKIKKLQEDLTSIGTQFGQIKIAKMKLEDQEIVLKKQLDLLTKEESSIAKAFTDKYGRGSLDVETGEFTPTK
tara:strand:- start:535 stop:831 length:297 start_codon:yes stop_codon:yes gene_type:complete